MGGGVQRAAALGGLGDDDSVSQTRDQAVALQKAPAIDDFTVAFFPFGQNSAAVFYDVHG